VLAASCAITGVANEDAQKHAIKKERKSVMPASFKKSANLCSATDDLSHCQKIVPTITAAISTIQNEN
jgi:hypothetical protein